MTQGFTCAVEANDLTESIDDALLDELGRFCCFTLDQEGMVGDWEIALLFTSDEHMCALHAEFMGLPETTDILTFPADESHGGDIVISVAQADRQRIDDKWDLESELRFLVAHGALHLAGWNDESVADRDAMLEQQRTILARFQFSEPSSNR